MNKIMICIPTLASAGAERFATELACNINRKKFEPIVLVTNKLDKTSSFYKQLLSQNISVYYFNDCPYRKKVWKIRNLIRKEKPSIIHTNVGAALHMLLPIAISFTRARHLFTAHSMGYRIFCGFKKFIMEFCFYTKLVIPVAICDTVKQSLIDAYKLKSVDVECVYNGVDTNVFCPSKTEKENSQTTFVSTGTLYHIKNHELLINAFSILHKEWPDTLLRIIGDGELREQLNKQVDELGLTNSVIFEGNQSDIVPYLRLSDVYCCTSKVEGLPISVLEAMACGLPIISTPAGGVVDIVKDGENGFIVNSNDKIIAKKMNELAKNKSLIKNMGKKSRELVMKYDIIKCAEGYEELYEKYSRKG